LFRHPKTLLGRTVFVIAAVLIITQLFAIFLFRAYNRGPLFEEMASLVTGQLRVIGAALEALPEDERIDFLDILEETQGIRVIPDAAGQLPANEPQSEQLQDFADYLRKELGDGAEFFVQQSGGKALWVRLSINNEKYWISIPRKQIERSPPWLWFGWMAFSALLVLLGAYVLVRRVNRPLRELTSAVSELGAGKTPPRLHESGPSEIRDLNRAFNQMADDIRNHDAERALLLAGISHDLRTPLSRLRLSIDVASNIEKGLHAGMEQDIEEIDAIIQQFLDFARAASDEPAELIDLNTLVSSAVKRNSLLDARLNAQTALLPMMSLRPLAMQRLLDNLITNALKYADGEVLVRTDINDQHITLAVLDRGPGIPLNQVDRLKRPFTRLESARSNAGNAGLGLAIVDRIATMHGATFELSQRAGGGLAASVVFPI
jgi:two-component system, OmpR family, osmolarity sensor histidine kinase EnvZ